MNSSLPVSLLEGFYLYWISPLGQLLNDFLSVDASASGNLLSCKVRQACISIIPTDGISVSYGCCNKLLQTLWLKTPQICSLTVLEVRSLKWVCMVALLLPTSHHCGPFLCLQNQQHGIFPPFWPLINPVIFYHSYTLALNTFMVKMAHSDNPGYCSISKSLTLSYLQIPLLPYKVT